MGGCMSVDSTVQGPQAQQPCSGADQIAVAAPSHYASPQSTVVPPAAARKDHLVPIIKRTSRPPALQFDCDSDESADSLEPNSRVGHLRMPRCSRASESPQALRLEFLTEVCVGLLLGGDLATSVRLDLVAN